MRLSLLTIGLIFIGQGIFAQKPIQRTVNTVGLISFDDKSKPGTGGFGTGTLIAKPISETGAFIFLVTNKHVLPTKTQNDSIHFKLRNARSKPTAYFDLVIPIYDKAGVYSKLIRLDPDGNDLAVINISEYFIKNIDLDYLIGEMFTTSFLITRDSMNVEQVDIGDEILFAGYPNVLYDSRNFSPIVRTGVIASLPSDDYFFNEIYRNNYYLKSGELIPEKLSGFLIDANVFHGSSGSLVFTKPRYFKPEADGELKYFTNPDGKISVLGVLTTSYFDINSPTDRLQLGGVISADQILKTMNLFVPLKK